MRLYPHEIFETSEILKLVHHYNLWFVNLRFLAVTALVLYIATLKLLPFVSLTDLQFYTMSAAMFLIFTYNFYFYNYLRKVNDVHKNSQLTALLQILLDLFFLGVLVYVNGGLEAPIFMFFVFHIIIGSVLLPKRIIYSISIVMLLMFLVFSLLEYNHVIPHFALAGLFKINLYQDYNFILGSLFIFGVMIIATVYLTKKIALDLYNRERDLRNAIDDLSKAELEKQKYIMAVVHELKSPIAAAASYIDLVTGGYAGKTDNIASDKLTKAKGRIAESIRNINNILHISRFKISRESRFEDVNIIKILENIKQNIEVTAARKNIKLLFRIEQNAETIIKGDQILLELALSNLLGNAVKYTPEKGNIICSVSGKEKLVIKVVDDGIGIPAEAKEKIFEEFYRADNVKNSNTHEGTGTGLAVVKNIIEAHKGSVSVVSPSSLKRGNMPGTEFVISLPVVQD